MQPKIVANNPWDITGTGGDVLRVGSRRLLLADVRSFQMSAHQERDVLASMLNYSAYLVVAAIFMVLVVQAGWRERFLLATIFFAVVGLTSLIDIGRATSIRLYRLSIVTNDGGNIDFVSPDPAQVDGLARALRRAGKG